MVLPQSPTRPRTWVIASLATLLLHAAAILLLQITSPFEPAAAAPPPVPEPIQVVFSKPEAPRTFTELPEDRADEPPERPEALSNVTSRARDEVPGGADNLARLEGIGEVPAIRLDEGVPDATPPARPEEPQEPQDRPEDRAELASAERSLRDRVIGRDADPRLRPFGATDVPQAAMRSAETNATLTGDISLSTTAWDFAPWMQKFRRAVWERWNPPIAYQMGMIDGWVATRLTISRRGEILSLEILGEDIGHVSLREAVVYALEAPAPYRPLPADFPDENLVLTIKFVYPALRR
jgi:hypothetical protein